MTGLQPIAVLSAIDLWDSVNTGDELLVRFGSFGSQAAIVTGRTKSGFLMARKYQAKSRRYTNPVRIHPGEILEIIRKA